MANMEQESTQVQVVEVLQEYHRAMVEADIDKLAALVDRQFSLTHITGYVQPRDEWFHVVRTGQFDYHRIDIDEVEVRLNADVANVAGSGTFNATINGTHAPWHLRFTLVVVCQNGRWKIMSACYRSD